MCSANALILKLNNLKSDKGSIAVAVFNKSESFPKKAQDAVFKSFTKTTNFPLNIKVPKGEYAISIFHDKNDNQKLDTNFIGIPKEAFGFSNDVMGLMGPPSFDEAKFSVYDDKSTISIKLKTFL
jgi:uncharacterized protein (DUF2141 family)